MSAECARCGRPLLSHTSPCTSGSREEERLRAELDFRQTCFITTITSLRYSIEQRGVAGREIARLSRETWVSGSDVY